MTRMVRLIGSEWNGSRLRAPQREIPEYGVKLKLKGRNFRVKHLDSGELVAVYLGQLADDVVEAEGNYKGTMPMRRYVVCEACNYDRHQCGGCGAELSHDGINLSGPTQGFPHELDRCYE